VSKSLHSAARAYYKTLRGSGKFPGRRWW